VRPVPAWSPRRAWRRIPARTRCVTLVTVWSLLGAIPCAILFGLLAFQVQSSDPWSSPVGWLVLAGAALGLCALPVCGLMPVPLLIAGRRYLRRSTGPGTRELTAWTVAASAGIAVGVLFWVWVFDCLKDEEWMEPPPTWPTLDVSIAFLIVGAAMAGILLSTPQPAQQPPPPAE
jgi:hypothetical protein